MKIEFANDKADAKRGSPRLHAARRPAPGARRPRLLPLLLPWVLCLPCLTGCKTASTRSRTDFFDAAGRRVATRREHTHVTGFLVKSDSVALKGVLNYTNSFALPASAGPRFSVSETKTFSADRVTYSGDADAIQAAGAATGNLLGNAVKAATGR